MTEVDLPNGLGQVLCDATARSGLRLAGWDLKWSDSDDVFYVLEANRMPAMDCTIIGAGVRASRAACGSLLSAAVSTTDFDV